MSRQEGGGARRREGEGGRGRGREGEGGRGETTGHDSLVAHWTVRSPSANWCLHPLRSSAC